MAHGDPTWRVTRPISPEARSAADLVQRQVTVIVSLGGTPGALAAKAATRIIPIVFQAGVDPVEAGIVASLNRPGGNITGVSQLLTATVPKQLQLMHEVAPAKNVAFLLNQTNPEFVAMRGRCPGSAIVTAIKCPSSSSLGLFLPPGG